MPRPRGRPRKQQEDDRDLLWEDLSSGLDPDSTRLPPPPPARLEIHTSLQSLLADPFWAGIIEDCPADAAVYAYCVMSGMPKMEAAYLATDLHGLDTGDMAGIVQELDQQAAAVFRRGMLAGGLNEFMIVRTVKEIMQDTGQEAGDRLKAAHLASQFLGKITAPAPVPSGGDVHITVNNTRVEMHSAVHVAMQDALKAIEGGTGLQIPILRAAQGQEADRPIGTGPGSEPGTVIDADSMPVAGNGDQE